MLKKKIAIGIGIAFLLLGVLFYEQIFTGTRLLFELVFNKEIQLKHATDELNILVLGIGGGTHEGPELTDTIILAHVNQSKNTVQLFSLPRDLWIPELGAKINTAYPFGQSRQNQGLLLARTVVEKVTGIDISYVVVLDFSGFVKLVDHLGGVDVDVKETLDDYEYPITGEETNLCGHAEEELPMLATASSELEAFPCRYKHIHFDKGIQHVSGEQALEFVRSRHAVGAQGTDFARSERQFEVIQAVRNKVLSLGILLNPVKVVGIYNIVKGNVNTDIVSSEYDDFIKLARKMEDVKISSHVIQVGDKEKKTFGLLENPTPSQEFKYQWVLIPRRGNGDFSEIHEYIECIQSGSKECIITETSIQKTHNQ